MDSTPAYGRWVAENIPVWLLTRLNRSAHTVGCYTVLTRFNNALLSHVNPPFTRHVLIYNTLIVDYHCVLALK